MNARTHFKKGFTLIELLLVISIISLLSSVVIASTNVARAKTRDARKQIEGAQVQKAYQLYQNSENADVPELTPGNYLVNGTYDPTVTSNGLGNGNELACEDMANPDNPQTESGKAYNKTMQALVDAQALPQIPHSPGGQPYCVYNYGPNNDRGFVFATAFETIENTDSIANTCKISTKFQCPLAGDANGDDSVDFNDLLRLAQNYNTGPGLTRAEGDFNGDGYVNSLDLDILSADYNHQCVNGVALENICTAGSNNGEVCYCNSY